jgi:ParB family chromosome partitioning protein
VKAARARAGASPPGEGVADCADGDDVIPPWEEPISTLPKALTRELTEARTRAIRWKLSESPDLALTVTIFALSRRIFAGYSAAGIGLDLRTAQIADHDTLNEARAALGEIIPNEASANLEWLLGQPRQTLLEILAVLVSSAVDLVHEGASRDDARKQDLADHLAIALDLDMSQHWRPGMAFWSRLSKAALIDALMSAPDMAELSDAERVACQKAQAKRAKDDIAKTVAQALEGTGWLPDVLKTPEPEPRFALTASGEAALVSAA